MDQFLCEAYLDEVNRDMVEHISEAKLATGVANATANRMLSTLRALLRKAAFEMLKRLPLSGANAGSTRSTCSAIGDMHRFVG